MFCDIGRGIPRWILSTFNFLIVVRNIYIWQCFWEKNLILIISTLILTRMAQHEIIITKSSTIAGHKFVPVIPWCPHGGRAPPHHDPHRIPSHSGTVQPWAEHTRICEESSKSNLCVEWWMFATWCVYRCIGTFNMRICGGYTREQVTFIAGK